MKDWFIWNGVKCTEYGVYVLEQPPMTTPAERATFTNIPGRSGSLTTLEGDAVYDDLLLTAQCLLPRPGENPRRGRVAEGRREGHVRQPSGRVLSCSDRESDPL